jgi:tRNA(fMet)-specific endonuclease VapC
VKYLLDTNTCIAHLRGKTPTLTARLAATAPGEVVLCSIVKAELIFGVLRSSKPVENRRQLDGFFAGLSSLPFDDLAAEEYGRIRAYLTVAGTPIGPNDLLIAAIAIANRLTVVTRNVGEFGRVPGIAVEDWQATL